MKIRKKKPSFLLFVPFVLVFFIPLLIAEAGFSNSITLEDVIGIALANNKQVLDSQASLQIVELNLERAEKLFGSPQINLNLNPWGGYYDEGGNLASSAQLNIGGAIKFPGGTDISLNYQGTHDYESGSYDGSYSLELYQSLFQDSGLSPSAIELYNARKNLEKAHLNLEQLQKEIILTTVKSFYEILGISDSLNLVKRKTALSQKELEETIREKDSGLVGELDILRAKIELAEKNKQLSKLEDQLALVKEQFCHSIGTEKDSAFVFPPIQEKELREKAEELLAKEIAEEALLSQSELREAQWTIDEKRLQLRKKEKDTSANWSLSIGYTSEKLPQPAQWQANIGVSYNLFDGGRAKLLVEIARIDLEKAERNFEDIKENIQFELSSKRDALKESLSQLNLWELREEEMELKYQLAEERFALGILSSSEFEEFQLQEMELKNSYQSALCNLLDSYFSYGTSLQMELDIGELVESDKSDRYL